MTLTQDSFVLLNGRIVQIRDITLIDISQNYVKIQVNGDGKSIMVRGTLKNCLQQLPGALFFQANRNCIVNLSQIAKVDVARRNIMLIMKDGRKILMSRNQSLSFERQLAFR